MRTLEISDTQSPCLNGHPSPLSKNLWLNFVRLFCKFPKLIRRPSYRNITCFEISQGVRFPHFYQAYTFESKKWSLKNYLEFLERSFCNLEIIYFYHLGFTLLKRTTFWNFPLNQKKNTIANKKHENLSPRHQKQRKEMM